MSSKAGCYDGPGEHKKGFETLNWLACQIQRMLREFGEKDVPLEKRMSWEHLIEHYILRGACQALLGKQFRGPLQSSCFTHLVISVSMIIITS